MTMKSSTRQVDGVTIVDLSGRITLGEGSIVLRDSVRDLLNQFVCIDLFHVSRGRDITICVSTGSINLISMFVE